MDNTYWIESTTYDNFNDMYTTFISTEEHDECVVVYGDDDDINERSQAVLKALNRIAK